jgi:protein TonB
VEFNFRDGAFSHLRIVQSAGSGMLDAAALAAVTNAAVPPVPESLRGREMTYQVTVAFDLNK